MDASLILDHEISDLKIESVREKMQPRPIKTRPDSTLDGSRRKMQAGGINAIKINRFSLRQKNVILSLSGDRKTLIYRSVLEKNK